MNIGKFLLLVCGLWMSGIALAQSHKAVAAAEPSSPSERAVTDFRFAIIGDRTGAHRPGVFADAIAKAKMLRPDFVISVGDLIEGYRQDQVELNRQWDEVDDRLSILDVPVHVVPGNHDVFDATSARLWNDRRGAPYWHFAYRDVLFLGVSTEDPPIQMPPDVQASARRLEEAMRQNAQATQAGILSASGQRPAALKLPGNVAISDRQLAYFQQVLDAYPDSKWTFVIMHKPAWAYNSTAFAKLEEMLGERPYTMIAGHEHYYAHEERNGRDYITMGTSGGVWLQDGPGRADHITWVTMGEDGPTFANLRIDGIAPKTGFSKPSN